MYATELYSLKKRAGLNSRDLIPALPNLPNGRRITIDFYGRIERCEVEIEPVVYDTIVETINRLAAARQAAIA